MATGTKTTRSFKVACPFCGNGEETVRIDLNDLTECVCTGCDETFSAYRARDEYADKLAQWEKVVKWIEAAGKILAE